MIPSVHYHNPIMARIGMAYAYLIMCGYMIAPKLWNWYLQYSLPRDESNWRRMQSQDCSCWKWFCVTELIRQWIRRHWIASFLKMENHNQAKMWVQAPLYHTRYKQKDKCIQYKVRLKMWILRKITCFFYAGTINTSSYRQMQCIFQDKHAIASCHKYHKCAVP